jgi:hypothetical protein
MKRKRSSCAHDDIAQQGACAYPTEHFSTPWLTFLLTREAPNGVSGSRLRSGPLPLI